MVGQFLGVRQVPITYETKGETRVIKIEKYVDGAITPVRGKETVCETGVPDEKLEDHIVSWPGQVPKTARPRTKTVR